MTIEQSKEKLKKDGYTWFDVSDIDIEFYEKLKTIMCNEEKNIKKYMVGLRSDVSSEGDNPSERHQHEYDTFEEAFIKKEKIINTISEKNKEYEESDPLNKKVVPSQIWYYTDGGRLHQISPELNDDVYEKYVKNVMMYFYDFDESQKYSLLKFVTYYDKGCVLQNHSDGTGTGRICAMLIYLNEEYDENDGGVLILNSTEKVIPTFGKAVIIDLQTFDIQHEVTEVTGGIGRYALLNFVKRKEDEFFHG